MGGTKTTLRAQTREHFISVARELFAEAGYQMTTMNEIARRARKSRRTLYTYFSTKEEVYMEVIQQELRHLYEELVAFVNRPMDPMEKMLQYAARREVAVSKIVKWNGSLEAEFFKDFGNVERARIRFDVLERDLIAKILREGMEKGAFKCLDLKRTTYLLHAAMKGLEVPFIRGQFGRKEEAIQETYNIVRILLLEGLKK